MNRLWYRITGNTIAGFVVGYTAGFASGGNAVDVGVIAGVLNAALSAAKEFTEYGNYGAPEDKRKNAKVVKILANSTIF